jgi:hypothetical protein
MERRIRDVPESCNTPLHTCDALDKAIEEGAHRAAVGDSRFVSVDVRVLRWLVDDARTLNLLISAVHHAA